MPVPMKEHSLGYYLMQGNTLFPTTADFEFLKVIETTEWMQHLGEFFDMLIWEYYSDRTVFYTPKFDPDVNSEADIYNQILFAFAINLSSRKYTYERAYNTIIADYNPLYNVDGYEYEDRTLDKSGTDTDKRTGDDKMTYEDNGDITNSGNDVSTDSMSDSTQEQTTTFDSDTDLDTTKTTITYGKVTTLANGKKVTNDLDGFKNQNYNSTFEKTLDLNDTEHIMRRRYGNIGVTKSTDLIDSERKTILYDFYKMVVHDCVNLVSYAIY